MKKQIKLFFAYLLSFFKAKRYKKAELEQSFSYNEDKGKWIRLKGRPKMKLRKHISEIAVNITAVSNNSYEENRRVVINYYNKFGLIKMHDEIINQFNEFNLKNSKK